MSLQQSSQQANEHKDTLERIFNSLKYVPAPQGVPLDHINTLSQIVRLQGQAQLLASLQLDCMRAWAYMKMIDKREMMQEGLSMLRKFAASDVVVQFFECCEILYEALNLRRDTATQISVWERHVAVNEKKKGGEKQCLKENTHLLQFYIELRQMQKAQQQAMKLYRISGSRQHLYWAVAIMILQAKQLPADSMQAKTMWMMATRMLEQQASGNQPQDKAIVAANAAADTNAEIVHFFAEEFMQNGQIDDALKLLLDDQRSKKLVQFDANQDGRLALLARSLRAQGKLREANALYQHLISSFQPDEWQWWLDYIETAVQLMDQGQSYAQTTEAAEVAVQWNSKHTKYLPFTGLDPIQFIRSQQQKALNGKNEAKYRGPFLAELELSLRAKKQVPLELVVPFFEKFGSKLICFADLLKYLPIGDNSLAQQLVDALEQALSSIMSSDAVSESDKFYYEINSLKLRHVLIVEDAEQTKISIQHLHSRYVASKALNTKLQTDFQVSDSYVQLMVHKALRQSSRQGHAVPDTQVLLDMAALLEDGIKLSPSNFQLRFLAIRVYVHLGAHTLAVSHFKKLDVKNIQFESVSYILYYDLLRAGQWSLLKFMAAGSRINEHEHSIYTGDAIWKSLSRNNLGSVAELYRFADMLDRTFNIKQGQVDTLCFQLKESMTPFTSRFNIFSRVGTHLAVQIFVDKLNAASSSPVGWFLFNEDMDMIESMGRQDDVIAKYLVPSEVLDNSSRAQSLALRTRAILAIGTVTSLVQLLSDEVRAKQLKKQQEKDKKKDKKQAAAPAASEPELDVSAEAQKLRQQLDQQWRSSDLPEPSSPEWIATKMLIEQVIPSIFDFCSNGTGDSKALLASVNQFLAPVSQTLDSLSQSLKGIDQTPINKDQVTHLANILFFHVTWWVCTVQSIGQIFQKYRQPTTKPAKGEIDPIKQFKTTVQQAFVNIEKLMTPAAKLAETNFASTSSERLFEGCTSENSAAVLKDIKASWSASIEELRKHVHDMVLEANVM